MSKKHQEDPFAEFGGKSVSTEQDPFAEFGGRGLEKKPSSRGVESTSPSLPSGGITDLNSLPSGANKTPTPLTAQGAEIYNKEQSIKQAKAEKLSNQLKSYQKAYESGRSAKDISDLKKAKDISDKTYKESSISPYTEKSPLETTKDFGKYLYNKVLQGSGSAISGLIDLSVQNISNGGTITSYGGFNTPATNPEETIKNYRENIAPQVKSFLKDNIGADLDEGQERKFDEGFVTGAVGGLLYSAPAMITPYGIGMFSQAYDSGLESINNTEKGKNLSESQKTLFAGGIGLVVGTLEKVGLDKIVGKGNAKVANTILLDSFESLMKGGAKKITKELLETEVNAQVKNLSRKLLRGAGELTKGVLHGVKVEGTTGGLQELGTVGIERLTNYLSDDKIFDEESMGELAGRVLKSGAQEAIGGGLLGGMVGGVKGFNSDVDSELIKRINSATTFNEQRNVLLDIERTAVENGMDENSINELTARVNELMELNKKLPSSMSAEEKSAVIPIIEERNALQEEIDKKKEDIKTVDEAFKKEEQARIDLLEERKNKLNEFISDPTSEDIEEQPTTETVDVNKQNDVVADTTVETVEPTTTVNDEVIAEPVAEQSAEPTETINTESQQEVEQPISKIQTEAPITNPKAGGSEKLSENREAEAVKPIKEGDKISLPPNFEGGRERNFEYKDGEWKQKIGNEYTDISKNQQEQLNTKFNEQGTTIKETKETAQPIEKPTTKEQVGNTEDTKVVEPVKEDVKANPNGKFSEKIHDKIASDEIAKTLSNLESESRINDLEEGDLTHNVVKDLDAIRHGQDVISSAREEFGDGYIDAVLSYATTEKNGVTPDMATLVIVSLENDIQRRIIEEPLNERQLRRKLKQVQKAGLEAFRTVARANRYGALRKASAVDYETGKITDAIFSIDKQKDKAKIKKLVEDVTPEQIQEQAEAREQEQAEPTLIDLETLVEKSKSTKEKKKKAIEDFNKSFDSFYKAITSKSVQSTFIPYAKQLADATPHIIGMAKALKSIGGLTAKQIIEQIHNKVKPHIEGITEKDVSDIISKKGVMSPELKRKLYIKQLERQITELDQQIEDGKRKIVTKEDKYKNDEEIAKLRDERESRKVKLAEIDPEYAERRKLETDLKNAQKSLDEWQKKVDNNDFTPAEKKAQNVNEKLQELRDRRDSVKDKFNKAKDAYEKSLITPEMIAEKEVSKKIDANKKAIDELRDKLDKNDLSTNTKQSSLWTAEIGKLEQEKAELQKELNERRKATKEAKEKAPLTSEELLEKAKENIRDRIAEKKQQIEDKKVELKIRDKKFTEDAEYKALESELEELTELSKQYLTPESKKMLDDREKQKVVSKLESDIEELDQQIEAEQKTAIERRESVNSPEIEALKAKKKAKVEVLEQIDPDTKQFVKQSLIDAGYSKEITVTRKGGIKEKINILNWNMLSTDGISTIRDVVEKALERNTDISEAKKNLMINQLENEYISLQKDIIEKGIKELNRGNKVQANTDTKTLATRIAEMYNKGLFDKNPDTYDYLVNKTFGTSIKDQELFFKIKDLAKAISVTNDFKSNGNRLSDIAKSTLNQEVKEKIKDLLQLAQAREASREGGVAGKAFLASEISKQLMASSQRQLLVSLKQALENPASNYTNDIHIRLQDLFKKEKWDTKDLREARMNLSKTIYNDTLLHGGTEYGGTGNAFVSRNAIENWVSSLSQKEMYQAFINLASGKPFLDSADSAFKIKRTELEFTHNLLRILTDKSNKNPMTQDEALAYVSEQMTGQSLESATKVATELIEHVNNTVGRNMISDRETNIRRIANDIMKDGLVSGGKLTADQVKSAFDAAYVTAGSGIGHEPNNIVSKGVGLINRYLQSEYDKAIKKKEWGMATMINAGLVAQRNFLAPFVGGGTNWTMIGLQRIGLPTQYLNFNSYGNKTIDLSTTEGLNDLSKTLERKATLQRANGRNLIGLSVQLATLATAGLIFSGDKGEEDKEKVMKWMREHPEITKYSRVVSPFALQIYFSKDDDEKMKAILSTIGSRYGYQDDGDKIIKSSKDLYDSWANNDPSKKDKAWGTFGEYLGGKTNIPYAPARFYLNLTKLTYDIKGKPVPYVRSMGFMNGYMKNGLGEVFGWRDAGGSADILMSLDKKALDLIKSKGYELKSKEWGEMKINDIKLGSERVATKTERDVWNKEYNDFIFDYIDKKSDYLKGLKDEEFKDKMSQVKEHANAYAKYRATKEVGNILYYSRDGIAYKTTSLEQSKIMALYNRYIANGYKSGKKRHHPTQTLQIEATKYMNEHSVPYSIALKIKAVAIRRGALEKAKKEVLSEK